MVLHPLWNPSMTWPWGGRRSSSDTEKKIYKITGSGTSKEPKIVWLYDMNGRLQSGNQTRKAKATEAEEVEKMIKAQAAALKCTHAWIIAGPHPVSMAVSVTGIRHLVDDEPHITARFGTSDDWCLFSSHIYTAENPDGTLFLRRDDGGPNPQTWAWGDYPTHLIPPGSQDEPWKPKPKPVIHYTLSTRHPNLTQRERKGTRRVKKAKENQEP
ncbi:hypothetical protein GGR53DRAFT_525702 [Hypoxylon sp. FL1150]|nr:hypothetical protein GGR53DRAFT_525702 [Hypoxylon sp. FL1150]